MKAKPVQNRKLNREIAAERDGLKALWVAAVGKPKTDVEILVSRWKVALSRMAKPGENPRPIPNFEWHNKDLERIRTDTAEFICRAMQSWDFERIFTLGKAMIESDHAKTFTTDWPGLYLLRAKKDGQPVNLAELKKQAEESGAPVFSFKTWERRAKTIGVPRVSPGRPNKDS